MLTLAQLQAVMPRLPADKAAEYLPHLNAAMEEFGINTPDRQAAFLAQLAHESGQLRYMEEWDHKHYLAGCRECERQRASGMDKDSIGHAAGVQYENRRDLGNNQPGDGERFKGRGCLQITGRANYTAAGKALGLDLVGQPDLVLRPEVNFRVAGWFWATHPSKRVPLNECADIAWKFLDRAQSDTARLWFDRITRAINGGLRGANERWAYYLRAREVLGQPQDKEEGRTT